MKNCRFSFSFKEYLYGPKAFIRLAKFTFEDGCNKWIWKSNLIGIRLVKLYGLVKVYYFTILLSGVSTGYGMYFMSLIKNS